MELLDPSDYYQSFSVNLRVSLFSFCEFPGSKSNGSLSPIIHNVGEHSTNFHRGCIISKP